MHGVISSDDWRGDETLDPKRSLLSEVYDGTIAELRRRPAPESRARSRRRCRSKKPRACRSHGSPRTGCCSRTPVRSPAPPCSSKARAAACRRRSSLSVARAGYRVWVTSRTEEKRARAVELGADAAFEPGARLPDRVDAVMETVGAATWEHSLKSLRPGGTLVVSGATAGANPPEDLRRDLLPPAPHRRFDDGHARRAPAAWRTSARTSDVRPVIDRSARSPTRARRSSNSSPARCSANSS